MYNEAYREAKKEFINCLITSQAIYQKETQRISPDSEMR